MRVHIVPARYRPELEAKLREALRTIAFDMKMRALDADVPGAEVSARYLHDVDESKEGSIVVLIADVPADNAAQVFPIERTLKVAS